MGRKLKAMIVGLCLVVFLNVGLLAGQKELLKNPGFEDFKTKIEARQSKTDWG